MPRKKAARRGGVRKMNASLRDLVEQITAVVAAELETRLPSRRQVQDLDRRVRAIAKRVDALSRRPSARRVGRPPSSRSCDVEGCELPHVAQGYCSRHYQAWRRKRIAAGAASPRQGRPSKRG